jgi:DNA-binding transcriptional LysR family regulator
VEGGFATLQRELRDRNIELMIGRAPTPVMDEDVVSEVLLDDRFVVVAGSRNKWSRRKKIKFADLLGEPWVYPRPGTVAASLVNEAFLSAGLKPPRGAASSSSRLRSRRWTIPRPAAGIDGAVLCETFTSQGAAGPFAAAAAARHGRHLEESHTQSSGKSLPQRRPRRHQTDEEGQEFGFESTVTVFTIARATRPGGVKN